MRHCRDSSDTTNAEWALIELLLPAPVCDTRTGGRPERHPPVRDRRRHALRRYGLQVAGLPADFPH